MPSYNYFPILKSTDAELRALSELPDDVKSRILPIIELTRSRRSKTNGQGDVRRRLDSLLEAIDDRPFILDLTTESTLQNSEIEELLASPAHGFAKWVDFVEEVAAKGLSVIPVIHYNPEELAEVRQEIRNLREISDTLAFRVGVDDDVAGYLEGIDDVFDSRNLLLILDAGYHDIRATTNKSDLFPTVLAGLDIDRYKAVVCAASSFPSSVSNFGDESSSMPIAEVSITEELRRRFKIFHGDFGSVHPVRYEGRWGGWVPRVDFPTDDRYFYYRYRREEGGYAKAARRVRADSHYRPISEFAVWGDNEIQAAASGNPNGRSPSHWISVRVNLHITHQFLRLKARPKMTL